jgi:hypothetical protein
VRSVFQGIQNLTSQGKTTSPPLFKQGFQNKLEVKSLGLDLYAGNIFLSVNGGKEQQSKTKRLYSAISAFSAVI